MPTKPTLIQIDDVERPATPEEKAQIELIQSASQLNQPQPE